MFEIFRPMVRTRPSTVRGKFTAENVPLSARAHKFVLKTDAAERFHIPSTKCVPSNVTEIVEFESLNVAFVRRERTGSRG